MKRIMMLLVVSVLFLMGVMAEGIVQNIKNSDDVQVVLIPSSISTYLGHSVEMEFYVVGKELDNKSYLISLWIQRSGGHPMELLRIDKEGRIIYRAPFADRITIFYDKINQIGTIKIKDVQVEDEADYYLAIEEAMGKWYWSFGTHLSVVNI